MALDCRYPPRLTSHASSPVPRGLSKVLGRSWIVSPRSCVSTLGAVAGVSADWLGLGLGRRSTYQPHPTSTWANGEAKCWQKQARRYKFCTPARLAISHCALAVKGYYRSNSVNSSGLPARGAIATPSKEPKRKTVSTQKHCTRVSFALFIMAQKLEAA